MMYARFSHAVVLLPSALKPGRAVVITFEKVTPTWKAKEHWPSLLRGHPTIDVSMLPSELNLAEMF